MYSIIDIENINAVRFESYYCTHTIDKFQPTVIIRIVISKKKKKMSRKSYVQRRVDF